MSLEVATLIGGPWLIPALVSRRWCGTCVAHRYIGMLTLESSSAVSAPWVVYDTSTFESVDPVGISLAIWKQIPWNRALGMISFRRPIYQVSNRRIQTSVGWRVLTYRFC